MPCPSARALSLIIQFILSFIKNNLDRPNLMLKPLDSTINKEVKIPNLIRKGIIFQRIEIISAIFNTIFLNII